MSADVPDVYHAIVVIDPHNQSILVSRDVEHHPPIPEDARGPKVTLDFGGRRPVRLQRMPVPSEQRLGGVGLVRVVSPESLERGQGDDSHEVNNSPILGLMQADRCRKTFGGTLPGVA